MKSSQIKYDFSTVTVDQSQPLAIINADLCLRLIRQLQLSTGSGRKIIQDLINQLQEIRPSYNDENRDQENAVAKAMDICSAFVAERQLINAIQDDNIDKFLVDRTVVSMADSFEVKEGEPAIVEDIEQIS